MKKISGTMKVTSLAVVTAVAAVGSSYISPNAETSSASPDRDQLREEIAGWDTERLDREIQELDELIKGKKVVLRFNDGRLTPEERDAARVLFERLLALRAAKLDRDLMALEKRAATVIPTPRGNR